VAHVDCDATNDSAGNGDSDDEEQGEKRSAESGTARKAEVGVEEAGEDAEEGSAGLERAVAGALASVTARSVRPLSASAVRALRTQLPLMSGATLRMAVPFVARAGVAALTFSVAYAAPLPTPLLRPGTSNSTSSGSSVSEDRWVRRVASTVAMLHSPGLRVVGVELLPAPGSMALLQHSRLPIARPKTLAFNGSSAAAPAAPAARALGDDASATSDASWCLAIVTVENALQEPVTLLLRSPVGLHCLPATNDDAKRPTLSARTRVVVGAGATVRTVVSLPRLAWLPASHAAFDNGPVDALWGGGLAPPLAARPLPLPTHATAAEAEVHAALLKAARVAFAAASGCFVPQPATTRVVDTPILGAPQSSDVPWSKPLPPLALPPPPSRERVGDVAVALAGAADAASLAASLAEAKRVGVCGPLVERAACRLATLLHLGRHLGGTWQRGSPAPEPARGSCVGAEAEGSTDAANALLCGAPALLCFRPQQRRGTLPLGGHVSLLSDQSADATAKGGGAPARSVAAAALALMPPVRLEVCRLGLPGAGRDDDTDAAVAVGGAAAEEIASGEAAFGEVGSQTIGVSAGGGVAVVVRVGQVLRLRFTATDVRQVASRDEPRAGREAGAEVPQAHTEARRPVPLRACLSPIAARVGAHPATTEDGSRPPMFWAGNLTATARLGPTGEAFSDSGSGASTSTACSFEAAVGFAEAGVFAVGLRCAYRADTLPAASGSGDDEWAEGDVGWSVVVSSVPLLVRCVSRPKP
jgi:hypothetical protein